MITMIPVFITHAFYCNRFGSPTCRTQASMPRRFHNTVTESDHEFSRSVPCLLAMTSKSDRVRFLSRWYVPLLHCCRIPNRGIALRVTKTVPSTTDTPSQLWRTSMLIQPTHAENGGRKERHTLLRGRHIQVAETIPHPSPLVNTTTYKCTTSQAYRRLVTFSVLSRDRSPTSASSKTTDHERRSSWNFSPLPLSNNQNASSRLLRVHLGRRQRRPITHHPSPITHPYLLGPSTPQQHTTGRVFTRA